MPDRPPSADPDHQTAVASYVATMAADLSAMARSHGLEALGYILDMARLEAETAARHVPHGPNGGR